MALIQAHYFYLKHIKLATVEMVQITNSTKTCSIISITTYEESHLTADQSN